MICVTCHSFANKCLEYVMCVSKTSFATLEEGYLAMIFSSETLIWDCRRTARKQRFNPLRTNAWNSALCQQHPNLKASIVGVEAVTLFAFFLRPSPIFAGIDTEKVKQWERNAVRKKTLVGQKKWHKDSITLSHWAFQMVSVIWTYLNLNFVSS